MQKDDSWYEALEFFRYIAAYIDKMEEKAKNEQEKRGEK